MEQEARQPTSTTATRGGISIHRNLTTLIAAVITVLSWVGVGLALAADVELRWLITAVAAAKVITIAAIAAKVLEVIWAASALNAARFEAATREHAERLEAATRDHCRDMRKQVINLNWLMNAKFGGEERARIEADRAFGGHDDTGPFSVLRRLG